jgi:hypothetical protein
MKTENSRESSIANELVSIIVTVSISYQLLSNPPYSRNFQGQNSTLGPVFQRERERKREGRSGRGRKSQQRPQLKRNHLCTSQIVGLAKALRLL